MEIDIIQSSIQLTKNSRLPQVNWENLPFGRLFSDHMFCMDFNDGSWSDPKIIPYGDIKLSPANSALHYGQSCFEGMKAHRNIKGEVVLFRPYENAKRFNSSNTRMCIPEINENIFVNSILELIAIDKKWVPENLEHSLYIRPFIFATDPYIGIKPSDSYRFMIFTCPVGSYYTDPVPVKVETHYSRAVQGGTGFAKAAGNYAASFYPTKQANAKGFQQLIWTDAKEHKYIEESGTMNIWFRIDDTLITPALSDSILGGITRDSIVTLAEDNSIKVEQRKILISEVVDAYKNGTLKEAFGTGTAVTVNPINTITFREKRMVIESQKDSFAIKLKQQLQGIQKGSIVDAYDWTSKVMA